MGPKRLNCWEYKMCGREPGGLRAHRLGPCTAAKETSLNGVNGGDNAGRACWVIPGTLCGGSPCGSSDEKYDHCRTCDFFARVEREEGADYVGHLALVARLGAASAR